MLFIFELLLYLVLFTASVIFVVKDGPTGGIFFYPKPVQEKVFALGLADRKTSMRRAVVYLTLVLIGVAALPVLFIGVWNGVNDFKTAFFQALILLEVMNWFDGICIDFVWVRHSKFWIIPGTEELPYAKTVAQIAVKRTLASLLYLPVAALIGWLAVLL